MTMPGAHTGQACGRALLLGTGGRRHAPAAFASCLRAFLACFFFWARSAALRSSASLCSLLSASARAAVVRASYTDQHFLKPVIQVKKVQDISGKEQLNLAPALII